MQETAKKKFFSFLYLLCLYLAATLFDLNMFESFTIPSFVRIILFVIVLVLTIVEIVKTPIQGELQIRPVYFLLFIPLVFSCGSNIIYSMINNIALVSDIDALDLTENIIRTVICAVIEELIFRVVLMSALKDYFQDRKNKEIRIILSDAALFSLMHVINFYGNAPITVVMQLGYTLVMGVIFAALSLYAENMFLPSAAHILFNLLNMTLFTALFDFTSSDMNVSYVVFSIIIALISLAYGVLLFVLNQKRLKKEHDTEQC